MPRMHYVVGIIAKCNAQHNNYIYIIDNEESLGWFVCKVEVELAITWSGCTIVSYRC